MTYFLGRYRRRRSSPWVAWAAKSIVTGLGVAAVLGATSGGAIAAPTVNLYAVPTGGATAGVYPSVCTQADPCTLGWALYQTNSTSSVNNDAVTINLAAGTYEQSGGYVMQPTGGSPSSVELLGQGSGSTLVSGNHSARTFDVNGLAYDVTVEDLTLEDGSVGSTNGANLLVDTGPGSIVTLDDDVVTGGVNTGISGTGGQADVTGGTLDVDNSTVENSSIDGSQATGPGSLDVSSSTYYNNGGIGIANHGANAVSVLSSTISGNVGGIGNYGAGNTEGFSDTIDANVVNLVGSAGTLAVADSIVEAAFANCTGTVHDFGSNVTDDSSCGFSSSNGSKKVSDTQIGLQPLANNGGPTETQAITTSSAAYDWVPVGLLSCGGDDQRGLPFTQPGMTTCDAGAYQYAPPTLNGVSPTSAQTGAQIQLTGTNLVNATVSFGSGNVAAAVTSPSLTSLTVTVPTVALGSQAITVTNADGSTTIPFSVVAAPSASGSAASGQSPASATSPSSASSGGGSTQLTPSVVVPEVTVDSTRVKFTHAHATLQLSCAAAACAGVAELTRIERLRGKHHTRKTVAVVLASGDYSLAAGARGNVTLTLLAPGRQAEARAARGKLKLLAVAEVNGGKTVSSPVKAS